jgi:thiamine biosynthesis protein ThiS
MGILKNREPEGGEMEFAAAASISDVLESLGIESKAIQAVSVNGSIERNKDRALQDGDELTILPPVGGG